MNVDFEKLRIPEAIHLHSFKRINATTRTLMRNKLTNVDSVYVS